MTKKTVITSYVYQLLNKEEIEKHLESKDITDNEKAQFHNALSNEIKLFKTTRMGKDIIVSQHAAEQYINEDRAMMKFRRVMYTLLVILSIVLFGMATLDPIITKRAVNLADVVLPVLSGLMMICMASLLCDTLKENKKLEQSKEHVGSELNSLTDIHIELRNATV